MHGLPDLQADPGVATSGGPLFLQQPVLQSKGSAEAEHQQARFAADPGLRKLFGVVSGPLAAWRHLPAKASTSSNSQSASKQSIPAEISRSMSSSIVGGAADSSYSPRRLFGSGSSLGQQSPEPGTDSIHGGVHRQLLAGAAASPLNITVNIQVSGTASWSDLIPSLKYASPLTADTPWQQCRAGCGRVEAEHRFCHKCGAEPCSPR